MKVVSSHMQAHMCSLSLISLSLPRVKKSLDIRKAWNCDVCHKEYIKLYDKLGSSYLLDRERESFYPDRMNEVKKIVDEVFMEGDDE